MRREPLRASALPPVRERPGVALGSNPMLNRQSMPVECHLAVLIRREMDTAAEPQSENFDHFF